MQDTLSNKNNTNFSYSNFKKDDTVFVVQKKNDSINSSLKNLSEDYYIDSAKEENLSFISWTKEKSGNQIIPKKQHDIYPKGLVFFFNHRHNNAFHYY